MASFELDPQRLSDLEAKYGKGVYPFCFADPDEPETPIWGFVKPLDRATKIRCADLIEKGAVGAGAMIVDGFLIKEESDPRILSDDKYYLGACYSVQGCIVVAINQFKKK